MIREDAGPDHVAANAAMAVADEEMGELRTTLRLASEGNARLRAELEAADVLNASLREENARLRADVVDRGERLNQAHEENARLRAELEATQRAKRENDDRFQTEAADLRDELEAADVLNASLREENARIRAELSDIREKWHAMCLLSEQRFATIVRVRAALDTATADGTYPTGRVVDRLVRDALNAPATVANPNRTQVTE
ncbi:hypothetical protein I1A49_16545 [Streptomyces malaysiensis subsp. malaysiensis]|uniref:Uncharacterized protein n=1 Tax=Streptomyces malaysiensis TaxID=92644 RepID=A0ABX6W4K4_STRMQ|nr:MULTISPECIES: hypothetical protein [Streptomyces]QPI56334.1 hypothetical protein I1A49_16545 [Streptomyces solisilvae]UHH17821.1 hypothetical protein LUV23_16660 [Streptomyces sp. HNM0561]